MIGMTTVDKEGRARIEPVILVPKDYVPVVRCKDCKHWKITSDGFGECEVMGGQFLGDEYCSFGERKEE